jgi:murein DD-endopeptidase MepM/ murein hydrolase activator NlpD
MPAKGKHRRPKSKSFTRGFFVAGTGGAAVMLPLIGATGAHATQKTEPSVAPAKNVSASAPVTDEQAAAKAPSTYSVVPGDYLSKIAREQHVSGGWPTLYDDNREAVGADPMLIHPGLKLILGAKAPAAAGGSPAVVSGTATRKPAGTVAQPLAATKSQAPTSTSGLTGPLDHLVVITPYHVEGSMWASGYHTGVDFQAASGTTVKAVGAGTVVSAGWGGSYGNQVVIRHDDGHYSQYGHLSSLSVSAGQTVGEGQQIGLSGATGNATGPHLHFEIRTGPDYGSDIDPVAYLSGHGVSL